MTLIKLTEAVGVVIVARGAVSALSASEVTLAGTLPRHRVTPETGELSGKLRQMMRNIVRVKPSVFC